MAGMIRRFIIVFFFLSIVTQQGLLSAQSLPDSIQEKLEIMNPTEQIKYLSELCWSLREKDNLLALDLGHQALSKAQDINDQKGIAKISNFVGVLYLHYFFNTRLAIPFFHDALENGLMTKDSIQIAYAYNNLGDAFYLNGNYQLAKDYASKSFDFFTALNDLSGIAYSYVNIGLAQRLNHDYDNAIISFKKAIEYGQKADEINREADVYMEIANTLFEQNKFDNAFDYYQQSLDLHQKINNLIYGAYCLTGMANIMYRKDSLQEAFRLYSESLEMAETRNHSFAKISNLLGLALVRSASGQSIEGEHLLKEALQLATLISVPRKILECYETYAEYYKNIGDFEKATQSFTLFMRVSDSTFHQTQADILEEIRDRFTAEQNVKEADRLLKISKKERLYLFSVIILLIILVSFIVWKNRTHTRLNRELKLINDSKDKLFSIISHDLRNPFVAILQYVDLLKEEDLDAEQKAGFINDIDKRTRTTYDLLENLLNLSASRTGKIDFRPDHISLKSSVDELLDLLQPQIIEKQILIKLELNVDLIYADKNMINIVMRNLFINALKYSFSGGLIEISSQQDAKYSTISMQDHGTGMDKITIDNLFTTDLVGSEKGTSGEKGTGIGLSLCNEFIKKHGGTIHVETEHEKGSKFIIQLPIS